MLLSLSLISNLGLLCYFKYGEFIYENTQNLLILLGMHIHPTKVEYLLPIGISFYILHSVGYVLDVYHKRELPYTPIINYGSFVSFFPLLVAGPIIRIQQIRDQLDRPRVITSEKLYKGMAICIIGLFQKVVIADNLSVISDKTFLNISSHSPIELLIGLYSFAFQIYGDFGGYSNIALGISLILGFTLPQNFNLPYFSQNIQEFWRRWHISLSSWIRDYIYIPLGGNISPIRNLLISMALCGVWHGANWNMITWGIFHGILLVLHKIIKDKKLKYFILPQQINRGSFWQLHQGIYFNSLIKIFITFNMVCLGWLIFRTKSLSDIWLFLSCLTKQNYVIDPQYQMALILIIMSLALDTLCLFNGKVEFFSSWKPVCQSAVLTTIISLIFMLGGAIDAPFIYFKF